MGIIIVNENMFSTAERIFRITEPKRYNLYGGTNLRITLKKSLMIITCVLKYKITKNVNRSKMIFRIGTPSSI